MIFAKNGMYVEKYTAGHLCTTLEEFILIYEAMIAKNKFDLIFGCKLGQSDPIVMKLDTYWMYMPSFKLISQSMLKKGRKTRTDRRKGIATA